MKSPPQKKDVRRQQVLVHVHSYLPETVSEADGTPLLRAFQRESFRGRIGLFFSYVHNPILILEISCLLSLIMFLIDLNTVLLSI